MLNSIARSEFDDLQSAPTAACSPESVYEAAEGCQ
jgi:hypothetical protein